MLKRLKKTCVVEISRNSRWKGEHKNICRQVSRRRRVTLLTVGRRNDRRQKWPRRVQFGDDDLKNRRKRRIQFRALRKGNCRSLCFRHFSLTICADRRAGRGSGGEKEQQIRSEITFEFEFAVTLFISVSLPPSHPPSIFGALPGFRVVGRREGYTEREREADREREREKAAPRFFLAFSLSRYSLHPSIHPSTALTSAATHFLSTR